VHPAVVFPLFFSAKYMGATAYDGMALYQQRFLSCSSQTGRTTHAPEPGSNNNGIPPTIKLI
jgi:hypothetical protein